MNIFLKENSFYEPAQQKIMCDFFITYLNSVNGDILKSLSFFENKKSNKNLIIIENLLTKIFNNQMDFLNLLFKKFKIKNLTPLGDMHQQGKSTLLIEENKNKFIIKPVPINFIETKNAVLSILNASNLFDFYLLKIISSNKDYSQIEFLKDSICVDVKKFSYHYGALIFVLTLLRGVDFHSENIFCLASTPVVVDCESLFYPEMVLNHMMSLQPHWYQVNLAPKH